RELPIGASVGLAMSSQTGRADDLLRFSDVAMYQAKALGRGRFEVFEPSMLSALEAREELETELRAILAGSKSGEMSLVYQPILDLATLDLVGVAAMARWHHPHKGVIDHGAFIGVAEEAG